MSDPIDRIEILPVSLLDEERPRVDELRRLARKLGLEFGWHYLLDLTWMLKHLGQIQGQRIMDAGAGIGVMQWYLAENEAEVISVDRGSRANLSLRFRERYEIRGLGEADLASVTAVVRHELAQPVNAAAKLKKQVRNLISLVRMALPPTGEGRVLIYNQDLKELTDLANDSLDAVVAVSSLEHNTPEGLREVVVELMRVLKPGGVLLATLGAARDQDWFHEPSKGWNYTEAALRRIFDLAPEAPANYDRHDELLADLQDCAELGDNLASFYARSGDNGMPWGKWDPQYQPVGVCKVKRQVSE